MKKVLVVAYQFPPKAGPGVHRSLNFVKHLREFGYEPIVITTDEPTNMLESNLSDNALLNNLPEGIKIYRISNEKNVRLYLRLLKKRLFYPVWFFFYPWMFDWSVRWALRSVKDIEKIARENDASIIYTSSSPFSAWLVGYKIKKRLNIKWVADIRDPFTDGYMWRFPSVLHWMAIRIFEKKILNKADKVIVNTPEVVKLYTESKRIDKNKVTYITNGY